MIKVAICDDEVSVITKFEAIVQKYCSEKSVQIETECFKSPVDLLFRIEHGICFDCIFLDILMPGINGMDTAAEIRNTDKNVKIIFMTSTSEYAVQSYHVDALYYQLKPIKEPDIFSLLDLVYTKCQKEQSTSLILRCKNGISRVSLNEISYCEVIHRTVYVHLTDGMILESIRSLDDLYAELAAFDCFLRPHRSFIVNLDHIKSISYRAIIMDGHAEIPVPRGKYMQIKDTFLKHAFQDKQVSV